MPRQSGSSRSHAWTIALGFFAASEELDGFIG
jgi:hypothetical protein